MFIYVYLSRSFSLAAVIVQVLPNTETIKELVLMPNFTFYLFYQARNQAYSRAQPFNERLHESLIVCNFVSAVQFKKK